MIDKMEFEFVAIEASKILQWLSTSGMKPSEKVAVLEAAAGVIRATLSAEIMTVIYQNALLGGGKK